MEIETQWSINDLADAHEMINWHNAGIRAEQEEQERKKALAAAARGRGR